MSRAVSSPTRIPLAYNSSSAARSRRCIGSWSSLATAARSIRAVASPWRSTSGRWPGRLGAASRRDGSCAIRPVLAAQPRKVRAAAALRAMVERAAPESAWLASQPLSSRSPTSARSSMPQSSWRNLRSPRRSPR